MTQQIQELINKIKSEGVEAADKQAKEIEKASKEQAKQIIEDAKKQAEKIIVDAKQEVAKKEESSQKALQQASRDMLLSLRQEIGSLLEKITSQTMGEALSKDDLVRIIVEIVKNALAESSDINNVVAFLSPEDQKKLSADIISKLQSKLKEGIAVKTSNDISNGFAISFDAGKSSFEFTDKSLAEFLSTFLNAEVSAIVQESAA